MFVLLAVGPSMSNWKIIGFWDLLAVCLGKKSCLHTAHWPFWKNRFPINRSSVGMGIVLFSLGSFGFGLSCTATKEDILTAQAARKLLPSGPNNMWTAASDYEKNCLLCCNKTFTIIKILPSCFFIFRLFLLSILLEKYNTCVWLFVMFNFVFFVYDKH